LFGDGEGGFQIFKVFCKMNDTLQDEFYSPSDSMALAGHILTQLQDAPMGWAGCWGKNRRNVSGSFEVNDGFLISVSLFKILQTIANSFHRCLLPWRML
jgi:hypothetical protein